MSLATKDIVEVLRLYKFPVKEPLTRKQKILRLYKKCLITATKLGSTKRSRVLMMGPPTNPFYIFPERRFGWDSPSHPAAIVHELFTQRKVETDPVLSDIYVKEAEQFILQHSRADPVPYKFNSENHPLYDRYKPIPKTVCIKALSFTKININIHF